MENGWQIYILCGMILSKEKKFTPIINVFLPCLLCVLCNLYIFICHTYSFAISFSFTKRKNWLGKWKLICYREIRGLSLGHLFHTFKLLYDSKTKSCDRNTIEIHSILHISFQGKVSSKEGLICTSPSWLSVTSSSSQCCWTRMASQMIECYQFRCHFAESQKMVCYLKREA